MDKTYYNLIYSIEKRRKELGISIKRLAELTGISYPTIYNFLSDKHSAISFDNLNKITAFLGLTIKVASAESADNILSKRAREKSRKIIESASATSNMELQPVKASAKRKAQKSATAKLKHGSKNKLWS